MARPLESLMMIIGFNEASNVFASVSRPPS